MDKFDKKYEVCANSLLQQIIDADFTIEEVDYILALMKGRLARTRTLSGLKLLPKQNPRKQL